jgi:toxin CcdB
MAQFDVHENRAGHPDVPYLLDIQSDLLARINVRVVVPLVPVETYGKPIRDLTPVFEVAGQPCVMATLDIGGALTAELGPVVGSLARERDAVIRAIDILLLGV